MTFRILHAAERDIASKPYVEGSIRGFILNVAVAEAVLARIQSDAKLSCDINPWIEIFLHVLL